MMLQLVVLIAVLAVSVRSDSVCPAYMPPKEPCDPTVEWKGCKEDSDCRLHHVCCRRPCYSGFCQVKRQVWGCPNPALPHGHLCTAEEVDNVCERDKDCKQLHKKAKCCPSVCSKGKLGCKVSKPKPGRCPSDRKKRSCHDIIRCGVDSDCEGKQKCCATTCGGSRCEDPIPKKPKLCFTKDGAKCACRKKRDCMYIRHLSICPIGNHKCKTGHVCCCGQWEFSLKCNIKGNNLGPAADPWGTPQ